MHSCTPTTKQGMDKAPDDMYYCWKAQRCLASIKCLEISMFIIRNGGNGHQASCMWHLTIKALKEMNQKTWCITFPWLVHILIVMYFPMVFMCWHTLIIFRQWYSQPPSFTWLQRKMVSDLFCFLRWAKFWSNCHTPSNCMSNSSVDIFPYQLYLRKANIWTMFFLSISSHSLNEQSPLWVMFEVPLRRNAEDMLQLWCLLLIQCDEQAPLQCLSVIHLMLCWGP